MSRDFRLYLADMCASAERIVPYTRGLTLAEFTKAEKTFHAVLRNLEVIRKAPRMFHRMCESVIQKCNGAGSEACVT